jgi:hypothetical protein
MNLNSNQERDEGDFSVVLEIFPSSFLFGTQETIKLTAAETSL